MFSTFTQGWAGMTVLDSTTKDRMSAGQIRKAGAIISNMQDAARSYSDTQMATVCCAVVTQIPYPNPVCHMICHITLTSSYSNPLSKAHTVKALVRAHRILEKHRIAILVQ